VKRDPAASTEEEASSSVTLGAAPDIESGDAARLAGLVASVDGANRATVLTHDNPDPDALASTAALAFLLEKRASLPTTVAFGGIVGRAENRALIQEMGVKFQRIESLDLPAGAAIVMVDTQPRAGNNSLPAGRIVSAVVDHHPPRPDTVAATFSDIRPEYGASCSMLVEYLRAAELEPEPRLATAMFYAIQSETMDLGREASRADVEASTYLYPLSDPEAISRIRHARVPASYFRSMHEALDAARRYGTVLAVYLTRLEYPDMVAEIADLFMQMAGIDWTIAIGRYREQLLMSMRTYDTRAHAGSLVRDAIGERGSAGGHGTFAGGRVPVRGLSDEEVDELGEEILADLLQALGVDGEAPQPLIPESGSTSVEEAE
jgi:nanoRNase/pAp phosphatase (c-di-AMP/oligoRNAs hydrolase)